MDQFWDKWLLEALSKKECNQDEPNHLPSSAQAGKNERNVRWRDVESEDQRSARTGLLSECFQPFCKCGCSSKDLIANRFSQGIEVWEKNWFSKLHDVRFQSCTLFWILLWQYIVSSIWYAYIYIYTILIIRSIYLYLYNIYVLLCFKHSAIPDHYRHRHDCGACWGQRSQNLTWISEATKNSHISDFKHEK